MNHNDIDALAREIMAYLSKRALDLLAARGVVQRRQLSDGCSVYGRASTDAPVQDAAHDDTTSTQ